ELGANEVQAESDAVTKTSISKQLTMCRVLLT
ncbi:MAG: hypothetical protein RL556_367, partial [Actinomycetota bacterium]